MNESADTPIHETVPNVLAERYASVAMRDVWSRRGKVLLERDFWIAVMKAQRDLGVPIPADAIRDYERVKDRIDLESIAKRERVTLHDVKARIEEFSDLAKRQFIHLGLTSRDLTENVEQLQIFQSLKIVRKKAVAALLALARRADEHRNLMITGRTHNVPAQPTTLGKRMAMFGQEMLIALRPARGADRPLPGAGAQGRGRDPARPADAPRRQGRQGREPGEPRPQAPRPPRLAGKRGPGVSPRPRLRGGLAPSTRWGPPRRASPRRCASWPAAGLLTEGFQEGQVGSSAMPHKANARNCERICGFSTVIGGYVTMTGSLAGDQWNEGDISCSVVRRVALPDAFFAIDGSLETLLTVLEQMEAFPSAIAQENERNLPFLATTTILMEAVKRGAGRETAHEAIKEHALAAVKAMRSGAAGPDLLDRLAADRRIGLGKKALLGILAESARFVGAAPDQVDAFVAEVKPLAKRVKGAADYRPARLL